MLFSILIPVYNVESYIETCINSIIVQNFHDYEVIIVDDGSKDRSGEICDIYAQKYPDQIKVIHQENKGLLMARRVAIKKATGKYLLFLDSDDAFTTECLNDINLVLTEHKGIDLLIFHAETWDGKKTSNFSKPFKKKSDFLSFAEKKKYCSCLLRRKVPNCIWSKVVLRDIVDVDADYEKYKCVGIGEDLLQSLPLITRAENIYYLNKNLYLYRTNNSSMTHTFNFNMYQSMRTVNCVLDKYAEFWLQEWNLDNAIELSACNFMKSVWQVLKRLIISDEPLSSYRVRQTLYAIANDEWFKSQYLKSRRCIIFPIERIVLKLLIEVRIEQTITCLNILRRCYNFIKKKG